MPTNFDVYREGRWTAIESTTPDGDTVKRRWSGPNAEYVENYRLDPDTGQWELHGTSYGPDQVEIWVRGELIANNNKQAQYTMRRVAGEQRITGIAS